MSLLYALSGAKYDAPNNLLFIHFLSYLGLTKFWGDNLFIF